MAKCKRCNVTILDNTNICPLCYCALEEEAGEVAIDEYPEIHFKKQRIKHASNMLLTSVLISTITLTALNGAFYTGKWWCIIPVASLTYIYLMFRLTFVSDKGYRLKIFQSTGLTLILVLILTLLPFYSFIFLLIYFANKSYINNCLYCR